MIALNQQLTAAEFEALTYSSPAGASGSFDLLFQVDDGHTNIEILSVSLVVTPGVDSVLTGTADANRLDGAYGNDTLYGLGGDDTLIGGIGNDRLFGGLGDDGLFGGDGNDTVSYANAAGAVTVVLTNAVSGHTGGSASGADGNDTLTDIENIAGSGSGDDLTGNDGANILLGGGGNDVMTGGLGDDRYYVESALDSVNEAAGAAGGSDIIFTSVSYTMALNVERMYLLGTANINGTGLDAHNDIIYGNAGSNILDGKTGGDNLNGGLGNDFYYVNTSADVVNEAAGAAAGFDTIFAQTSYTIAANVERLYLLNGGNYNASGRNGQDDFLSGNSGNNIINGFSGNDVIRGGLGNDTLTGGLGHDVFQFQTAPHSANNHDAITDFNIADDTIQLDNLFYTLIGANGALAADFFKDIAIGAQDADDVILHDSLSGNLYYDANGLVAGGKTLFADVTDGLALTSADFVVV